jgi:hypothetical protein
MSYSSGCGVRRTKTRFLDCTKQYQVLKMLNENDFVQKVEHTKDQIPSIILYNKEQMRL